MKSAAETKFETARKRLSDALRNLEEVMKQKLHDAAVESKMIDVSEDDSHTQAKIIEQETVIQNLNSEINNLQRNLSDLGKEAEFLDRKNKNLSEKFSELKEQGAGLIEAIESDLLKIEEIISEE